ncbi:uncharacterized protein [Parasteatoda tepidariorum]|uniref:uncharacterized protein isoform X2 n=1 Tax=Parasteatoda tepidariorum TaxID=114398 RepID=UPI00077F9B8B|nr:uncharacterized protein LOC107449711 isoform X2 [Parasteatoda tepidariorum]
MIKFNRLLYIIRPNQLRTYASHGQMLAGRKTKRGSMLSKMIDNKDKNKKWHLNFMEKVKVSPCYQTLNVYWQIPSTSYEKHEEIAIALNSIAPRLRAELISRNVMGKVPYIFFIRDVTNARIAEFENALRDADLGPENERSIIPDDAFTKDVLVFRVNKKSNTDENKELEVKKVEPPNISHRPSDMKSDVFGLKHNDIMNKIFASKGRIKSLENSAVISSEFFPSAELFDKIPGTTLESSGIDRSKVLKQFQIERKIAKYKNRSIKITREDSLLEDDVPSDHIDYLQDDHHSFH